MSLSALEMVLLVLASYRLTHVLVFDKIAEPLRALFPGRGYLAYLVRCYWCAGVWVSAGMVSLVLLWPRAGQWVLLIFGVAGGQALLETLARRWERRGSQNTPPSDG